MRRTDCRSFRALFGNERRARLFEFQCDIRSEWGEPTSKVLTQAAFRLSLSDLKPPAPPDPWPELPPTDPVPPEPPMPPEPLPVPPEPPVPLVPPVIISQAALP